MVMDKDGAIADMLMDVDLLTYSIASKNKLPRSLAAVKEVNIASSSTSSPAPLTFLASELRFSLEVFVTNWIGIPWFLTRDEQEV